MKYGILLLLALSLFAETTSVKKSSRPTKKGVLSPIKKGTFSTLKPVKSSNETGLDVMLQGVGGLTTKKGSTKKKTGLMGFGTAKVGLSAGSKVRGYGNDSVWVAKKEKRVLAGDTTAMLDLGRFYAYGRKPRNYPKGWTYFAEAADSGSPRAMNILGQMCANGQGHKRSYVKAMEWYRKSAAPKYTPAIYNIAYSYQNGQGVTQNRDSALVWYKKAAELGEMRAMDQLGTLYSHRGEWNNAFSWFYKSAKKGNKYSYYIVGDYFYEGTGTTASVDSALVWYKKAAYAKRRYGAQKAALILYQRKNYSSALPLFKRETKSFRDKISAFYVGEMYERGKGVSCSVDSARIYYKKAAQWGHPTAKSKLQSLSNPSRTLFDAAAEDSSKVYYKKATVARRKNRYYEARDNYRKAIDFQIKAVGPEDVTVALLYRSLANTYAKASLYKNYDKVELTEKATCLKKATAIYEKQYKKGELVVPQSYVEIGDVYKDMFDHRTALLNYEKALTIYTHDFSDTFMNVPDLYSKIIRQLIALKRYKKALEQLSLMIDHEIRMHGSTDYNRGFFFDVMAIDISQNEYRNALTYCMKALKIEKEKLGENHGRVKVRYSRIADLYGKLGETAKAAQFKKMSNVK